MVQPARRIPWCTATVVAIAAVASAVPGGREALELRRAAVADGESWRLLGAHLVHAGPAHAILDLAALLVLGSWLELRSRAELVLVLCASALAASAAVWFARPDLERYLGSSALASGAFVALATALLGERRSTLARAAGAAALAAFALKLACEAAGESLAPLPAGVEVVPLAHAAGGLAGLIAASLVRGRALRAAAAASESRVVARS
jgi:rhomboid family GlyGly-CTERM serine protease